MKRKKLQELLKAVGVELEKTQEATRKVHEDASETAKTAAYSWSAAGEREYTRGQAEIARERYENIKRLEQELRNALEREVLKIEPPCFVEAEYSDGTRASFYLIKNPINIAGLKLVSEDSELGKTLVGEGVGYNFSVAAKTGKIISIG